MSEPVATVTYDRTVTRYHREWRHPRYFDGEWYRNGKSGHSAWTHDMPFGIGGGHATEAQAWKERTDTPWHETRVVKVTTTQTAEIIDEPTMSPSEFARA